MSDEPDPDEEQTAEEHGGPGLGEVSEEEQQEIEHEREERLDEANRPDDAEVDNTQRDFDSEVGMFEDNDDYDADDKKFDDGAF